LFNAIKNSVDIEIDDKINLEIMKRNNIFVIVSFDKCDLIQREEISEL